MRFIRNKYEQRSDKNEGRFLKSEKNGKKG